MYQLAKSPAELARLSALPPLDAAREIGRLEAKLRLVYPAREDERSGQTATGSTDQRERKHLEHAEPGRPPTL
jgi:hypothetical protein